MSDLKIGTGSFFKGALKQIMATAFVVWSLAAWAQYGSVKGGFQTDQIKGCAPLSINVSEVLGIGFCNPCNYEFEGGVLTQQKVHTFTQPGIYKVKVTFQINVPLPGGGNTDEITITVTPNNQPNFEISACANSFVSINITNKDYQQYLVDFNGDNTTDQTVISGNVQLATFNYGAPGIQTISVRGKDLNAADNCASKIQNFTALTSLPTPFVSSLTVQDNAAIELEYQSAVNVQYRAMVSVNNATTFQTFKSLHSATAGTQQLVLNSGLSNATNYYCFRVNTYDPCQNANTISNTICSAVPEADASQNDVVKVKWPKTSATGIQDFTLNRDGSAYQTVLVTQYDDTGVTCNTDYEYSIVSNYTNGAKSYSLPVQATAVSAITPDAIEDASAQITDAGVELTWVQNPAFTAESYDIFKKIGASPFEALGESTTPDFTDGDYEGGNCYRVDYADACGNQSATGATICPIYLTGMADAANVISLTWTEYTGWSRGVRRYRIDKYDANGGLIKTWTFANTIFTFVDTRPDVEHQVVTYVVTAEPRDPLTESISNALAIRKEAYLVFPTAFTPNKDGQNDFFPFKESEFDKHLPYIDKLVLKVFDRWGALVFSTETNQPWDGTFNGHLMPESSYIWKAQLTDLSGKVLNQIGSVVLLRK